ncbi:MAG: hypothetical protein ABI947_19915 [Chloroflexota bacterium]
MKSQSQGATQPSDNRKPAHQNDGSRGEHGFDSGKKVNGRNRHTLVNTLGDLLKVIAPAANSGEHAGAQRLHD